MKKIEPDYETPTQIASRLQTTDRAVSEMARSGKIPRVKIGREIRYRWPDVEKALARLTLNPVD